MYDVLSSSLSPTPLGQVYDVLNFDMIVMLRLPYTPGCAEWIYKVRAGVA